MLKSKWLVFIIILVLVLQVGCSEKSQEITQESPPIEKEENLKEEIPIDTYEEIDSLEEIIADRLAILAFWVSWSEESKQQLEILENVYKLVEEDVVVIGVHATAFDTISKEEILQDIEAYPFEMLLDEGGEMKEAYYVGNFPTMVFLDKKGKVVHTYTTLIEEDVILEKLTLLLESL
ncbi:TlpA disulfide reductase family protein [Clostridium formicaceticum]|uniref:Thiol-disulfide oxidoreductase n=1 Tax=Clostridium formicaceticum TaxID=1497 RepID=A0AAC9RHS0_9CLOT|nr:TlpA disulfide reductase family protein [Clostridium formicaceticum]AOY75477.1 hypothetical protein BJL90_05945 [Clostridium formicaceticum]ARE85764.1 thiol-disulfide oxidoreductase [Clostridium formicaceticum]